MRTYNRIKRSMAAAVLLIGIVLSGCDQPTATQEEDSGLWMTDYDAALKRAAAEDKYVLVNISGQTWCGWCIRLENEVFSKPEFKEFAEENLVPVLLDFARNGEATDEEHAEQHEALMKKFGVRGFPTILILNPQGKVIERDGYQRGGAPNYIEFIKTVIAADS